MSISVGRATRVNGVVAAIADHVALTKPRVVSLLVVTGVCGYLAGAAGHVRIGALLAVAGGGALAAGGANALNCAFDRDLDAVMSRTRSRPIPDGRVPILHAVVLGIVDERRRRSVARLVRPTCSPPRWPSPGPPGTW